ncbi:hypothetical protein QTH90_08800 [Variovorax sp. J2P1-59]|uniref:hypothetical protein n=1 Tax=Variovorax flavidus TaxID=3053501 RepID=UPI002576B023|nr:hypothetical protein [Variovorax sp. J2P1-59]MDM0074478.1 hypothetical protein [Variovorax sp. J2P1-59]
MSGVVPSRPESLPGWRLAAHVVADPPPPDWRHALAERLGARPRRIGVWAELALHGAWQCLDAAGETSLPADARLRVASLSGPAAATRASLEQLRAGLPLPFDFMQSQPALMLAALAKGLAWRGDASFMVCRDLPLLTRVALQGAGPEGLLLGWIEEQRDAYRSEWWRWLPVAPAAHVNAI